MNSEPTNTGSFSFFDLDNTLYRGEQKYVIFDFPEFLKICNLFNSDSLEKLDYIKDLYKQKKIDREDFTLMVLEAYYLGLSGKKAAEVEAAANEFWAQRFQSAWYPYALDLLTLMNKYTQVIIVSGSPFEVLSHLKRRLNVFEIYASQGQIDNGVYTGNFLHSAEMATAVSKEKLIKRLLKEFNFNQKTSFAFGDSESDFPLLSAVYPTNSFLIGADGDLKDYGNSKGWNIVLHNDDIIYLVNSQLQKLLNNSSNP